MRPVAILRDGTEARVTTLLPCDSTMDEQNEQEKVPVARIITILVEKESLVAVAVPNVV